MTSPEWIITRIIAFTHHKMLGQVFYHSVNLMGVIYAMRQFFRRKLQGSGGSILSILPHYSYDVIVTSPSRVRLWFRPPFFSVCVIEHIYQVSYVQNENAVSCRFLKLTAPTIFYLSRISSRYQQQEGYGAYANLKFRLKSNLERVKSAK